MRYGAYELLEPPLGQGGMGVVYRARHTVLGTSACVKLLLPEYTRNPHVIERFINEARAAARLDHEHVVDVLDCTQTPEGAWYIVLEFLEGIPLSKWLRGKTNHGVEARTQTSDGAGATDLVQIARILLPVAGALHAAHDAGIVHRDVKPDNIMLVVRRAGADENLLHPVLLDFGIAKMRAEHGEGPTRSGAYLGTMAYMAPEQFGSAKFADRRTDVYALGGVLYQMVTGGFYAWGDANNQIGSTEQLYYRQVTEPPPDPRARNPAVSPAMANLVRWALTCDPRDRCPSALAFAQSLAAIVEAEGKLPAGNDLLRSWAPTPKRAAAPSAPTSPDSLGSPADLSDDDTWKPPASALSSGVPSEIVARPEEATRRVRPPPLDDRGTSLESAAALSTPGPAVMPTPMMPIAEAVEAPRVGAAFDPPSRHTGRNLLLGTLTGVAAASLVVVVLFASGIVGGQTAHGPVHGAPGGDGQVPRMPTMSPATSPPPAAPPAPGAGASAPTTPTSAIDEVPIAFLTEPVGAAVFVDDELIGSAPTKVSLTPGRSVRIRAELPRHAPAEQTYVVADHPDTVHLTLPAFASPPRGRPIRAGSPRPDSGQRPEPGAAEASQPFDPERLGQ